MGYHQAADDALARRDVMGALQILEEGLCRNPGSADFDGWLKLAAIRRRAVGAELALDAANHALSIRPTDCLALLLKASLHEQLAESGRAAEIYRAALFHAPQDSIVHPTIAAQIGHAKRYLAKYRRDVEFRLNDPAPLAEHLQLRKKRFLDNVLDRPPVFHQEPTHYRYPGLADIEFLDTAHAALCRRLREAYPAILKEFHTLLAQHSDRQQPYVAFAEGQPVGQWGALNNSTDWNAFHLIRYGEIDRDNSAVCPTTIAAFRGDEQADIPGLAPNLMFSLLKPRTHIPAHHGVANFRAVVHLPLIVPDGCRFRVGSETRSWIAGEPWIFDDTIEHEAWNDSDALRVVLIGDVWRPELDAADKRTVRSVIAALDGAPLPEAL